MFGLGFGEIAVILVLALVLLGPTRLPDAAKKLGKAMREFRRATQDLKNDFEGELYQESNKPVIPAPPPGPDRTGGPGPADPPKERT